MSYQWIRFLHIASAITFVALHGTSIVVLHGIRGERVRPRIEAALDLSGRTANAMYASLAAVVATGLWMGFERTALLAEAWYWSSLGLLIAIGGLMWVIAKPFTARIRTACEIRPSGVFRVSDAELAQILHSSRPNVVAAIGGFGLLAIVYLMVFQPVLIDLGGAGAPPPDGDDQVLQLGEDLFQRTAGGVGCAACHGADGRGTAIAPAIIGLPKSAISRALDEVAQMATVQLDDAELEAVYRYLQTLP